MPVWPIVSYFFVLVLMDDACLVRDVLEDFIRCNLRVVERHRKRQELSLPRNSDPTHTQSGSHSDRLSQLFKRLVSRDLVRASPLGPLVMAHVDAESLHAFGGVPGVVDALQLTFE